jgi:hypothetical protein
MDLTTDCAKKNANIDLLQQSVAYLKQLNDSEPNLDADRKLVDKLVNDIVGVDAITVYRFSSDQDNIFYRLLVSYTQSY